MDRASARPQLRSSGFHDRRKNSGVPDCVQGGALPMELSPGVVSASVVIIGAMQRCSHLTGRDPLSEQAPQYPTPKSSLVGIQHEPSCWSAIVALLEKFWGVEGKRLAVVENSCCCVCSSHMLSTPIAIAVRKSWRARRDRGPHFPSAAPSR